MHKIAHVVRVEAFLIGLTMMLGGAIGCGSSSSSPLTSIAVSPSAASILINNTQQFTASASNANGNVQSGVTFTSSSTTIGVATINSSGVATAVSVGVTEISANAQGITSPPATLTVVSEPAN